MTTIQKERIGLIARAYWQPLVLLVLLLVAVGQIYSWGATFIELKKVDSLIAKTENVNPEKKTSDSSPSSSEENKPPEEKKPAKNIFKREDIPYQLTAIFMDSAIIDGQTVKVGERVGKALVKEIALSSVKIQEDGTTNTREIHMFQNSDGGEGGRGDRRNDRGSRMSSGSRSSQVSSGPSGRQALSGRNPDMEKIRNMSPEQRRQFIQNMSPEERERMRGMARERFGGRPGGRPER